MGWLLAHAAPQTATPDAEAVRHLQQVLERDPGHTGSLAELGALYVRQGQFARARPLLEAARQRNPAEPDVTRNLARACARLGDSRASALRAEAQRLEEEQQRRRDLRGRHRRNPEDHATTLQLARLELAAGQAGEAHDLVRRILRADPNHRGALDLMHQLIGTPQTPSPSAPPETP
jgi:predicted Zn-dependent protease